MALGDFDTENFGEVGVPLAWAFFICCTIFNTIVMLNLLIAIICEAYVSVSSNADKAAYQEMVMLIDENLFLIPNYVLESYAPTDKYLLVVTNTENHQNDTKDPIVTRLD